MRVLFATYPERTHFLAMVPLAWALRTAGHDVRVASQPRFADVITQAGLTAVPVGRDCDHFFRMAGVNPALLDRVRAGLPPPWDVAEDPDRATWTHLRDAHTLAVRAAHKPDNVPIITGLVDYARHWQPHLIIWEPLTYAGAIAAKASGAAHGRLLFTPDSFGVTRQIYRRVRDARPAPDRSDPLADWLTGYAHRYGFDFTEDMTTGQFTIDLLPPALTMQADLHYLPLRYTPYGGPATIPHWLHHPPTRPRVALTLGISATDLFERYAVDSQELLDALADLDVDVVATIAEPERRRLTRIPPNTRVVTYAPLDALAATCAVVVNHAGPGTALTTALHAVPQLCLPSEFDGPALARRLATQGAALTLDPRRATGADIRTAVSRLLHEPVFRSRAATLRTQMNAQPSPNQIVPWLEELTDKHRVTCPRE